MDILLGRTVSQIKNRFYQNLKDKDISQIRYKTDNQKEAKCLNPKRKLHRDNKENTLKEFVEMNKRNKKAFFKKNNKEQRNHDNKISINLNLPNEINQKN